MPELRAPCSPKSGTTYHWVKVSDTVHRCGDIELRRSPEPSHILGSRKFYRWHYYVKVRGRYRRATIKSRPWGYGDAASAKVGFSKISEFLYE